MSAMEALSTPEVLSAIQDELGDWRRLAQPLAARYVTEGKDPTVAASFVSAVAQVSATAGHPVPEIRLGHGCVDLFLYTVDPAGGRWITAKDLELARLITGLAAKFLLRAAPADLTQVELALDAADHTAAGPFWAALLTGDAANTSHDSVFDPLNRLPAMWFQQTSPHEPPRQRWHLDVWLAPEVVEKRIAAALAAGGTLVDDSEAPSYTVLADPEGNKACVSCATGRG
ncbi:VOC family protein [Streptomyces sp. N35]|uniref:VOC family protein n=1 Tax=Streptomyces sp. N35 TaxID=2795730 RepID=UPI0018F568A9|nr:VOC family protein [Streptomyces sp. N35]